MPFVFSLKFQGANLRNIFTFAIDCNPEKSKDIQIGDRYEAIDCHVVAMCDWSVGECW